MFVSKKIKKGIAYYYLVETERIKDKVRVRWQKYLGTAKRLKYIFENGLPLSIESKIFGSVAAMLSIAEELQLQEIITRVVPDTNYKLKIGQHILMQSICRFHEPASKNKSIDWYDKSLLSIIWKKNFSSPQTILNQFDKIATASVNHINEIEENVCKNLLGKGIKPSILIWDPTNFFTYIEEGEELPRKGKSKEKRFDKNIINLGLVVSEENIPLMHTVYEGNKHESKVVTEVVDTIHKRLQKLMENVDVDEMVFVFDRGNNSEDNIEHIEGKFHFIGALKKNQLKHLFDVELGKFKVLYTNKSSNVIKGYPSTETVYDETYKVVVTFNEDTHKKQKAKTDDAIEKIKKKFKKMEDSINNKKRGKNATTKGIANRVNDFLYKQYKSLFSWEFDEKNQKFTWNLLDAILKAREKTYGKNILFTDLSTWPDEQVAKTYNSKTIVEDDFKVLKNRWLISVKPMFHQKDAHLRVHIFICVLSMIMYRYMLWKLRDLNMSENKITEELKNMRLAFVKQKDSTSVKKVLENMTAEQIRLCSVLKLEKYLPN